MSEEVPVQLLKAQGSTFSKFPLQQTQEDGPTYDTCKSIATNTTNQYGDEETESLKEKVNYLQLKLEEVQGECSLLKEWGVRIEMYIDCLADVLERNNITHVSDVDGSLVSLDECRQKAKTLPHTRKPHCDEELRTKQYEAEIEKLRQEILTLKTDLEDALQRNTDQEFLVDQLQTAEYQANRRWEAFHGSVMQQWGKCYSDLQGQYNNTVGRMNHLSAAFNNLKRRNQGGSLNCVDSFRRYRTGTGPMHSDEVMPTMKPLGQFQRERRPTSAFVADRSYDSYQNSPRYQDRNDQVPFLPRSERTAILKQFFANLNMIQRQQESASCRIRRNEPHRRPGPYGEN